MSTLKVNNIEPPNAGEGFSINGLQMPTAGPLSNRNRLINGSMEVAQRSGHIASSAAGYGHLDRWYLNENGASCAVTQETFDAGEERNGLKKYGKLSASQSAAYASLLQRIEDVASIPAGTVTVSFDAKGIAPQGGLQVWLVQNFGSGGSSEVEITPQTVTFSTSWQRHSLTFTVPALTGKTIGTNSYFQFQIGQHSNTQTTAWLLNITGVQLEIGSKSTEFEYEGYGQNLAKCQRYYQKKTVNIKSAAAGDALITLGLAPEMRTTPTQTLITAGTTSNASITTAFGGPTPRDYYFEINASLAGGSVIGRAYSYDAELN